MKYRLIIWFWLVSGVLCAQTTDTLLRKSQQLLDAKMYSLALDKVNESLLFDQTNARAYFLKALIEFKLENSLGALENLNLAIAYKSDYLEAYYNRGMINAGMQKYDEALLDYSKIIALNPNIPHPYLQRARIYFNLNRIAEAEEDFKKTIEYNSNNAEAFYYLAYIKNQAEQLPLALNYANKALALKKEYEDALNVRAQIHLKQKNYALATADFDQLIKVNPYNYTAFLGRGKCKTAVNQIQAAIADFDRIINKQAESFLPEAYLARGRANWLLKNIKLACEDWQKAEELGNEEAKKLKKDNCK